MGYIHFASTTFIQLQNCCIHVMLWGCLLLLYVDRMVSPPRLHKYTPKTLQIHGRCHYNFHTVLSIACSTFPWIFATHTHMNFSLTPYFIRKYCFIPLFYVIFYVSSISIKIKRGNILGCI